MKRGPKPGDESMAGGTRHKYTFDAWNRLVKVETWNWNDANSDGKVQDTEVQVADTVAEYRYDALNRRIRKFTEPSEGNWTVRERQFKVSSSKACPPGRVSAFLLASGPRLPSLPAAPSRGMPRVCFLFPVPDSRSAAADAAGGRRLAGSQRRCHLRHAQLDQVQ
jgi:hypothetical protein